MCARGFAAVCVPLRHGNVGAAARAGVRPKGPKGRGCRVRRGGRPQGPPLRGRREGNPGPVGLKERGCRTRRAGLGPAPTGKRNKARRADTFRPRYRISVFRGGGYAPLPHRVPAFRGADMNRSPHQIPAFRRVGYYPPAAPDTRPCVGAHSVRPRFCGCSRPPPTRKRWGRGPGRGTSQRAEGKGMADPAGRSGTGPYGVSDAGPGTSLRPAR